MKRILVRYTVKPDRVAENEELVRAVYTALHELEPADFRYATFQLEDGVTFVHLASIDGEDGHNPLPGLPAFQAFQKDIADRLDEGPFAGEVREIGSFNFSNG